MGSIWNDLPPRLDFIGSKGDRILWLDSNSAWGLYSTGEVNDIPHGVRDREAEWLKRIKELVMDDRRKHISERIDSVVWLAYAQDDPTAIMWQALDGLSPKHLQMYCGIEEGCVIEPLDTLKHPWTELKTFSLANNIDYFFMKPHKTLSQITSLTLDHCSMSAYPIPRRAIHLKELHIVKGSALDIFCLSVDSEQNPELAGQIDILEIHGDDYPMHQYVLEDFWKRLQKCTNLRRLTYTNELGYGLEVGLAEYIPVAVEELTLGSDRRLPFLANLDNWIKRASDPTWLPHLRSFSLTIDPDSPVRDLESYCGKDLELDPDDVEMDHPSGITTQIYDQEFDVKKRTLYEVLKSVKPNLHFPA